MMVPGTCGRSTERMLMVRSAVWATSMVRGCRRWGIREQISRACKVGGGGEGEGGRGSETEEATINSAACTAPNLVVGQVGEQAG